MKKIIFTLLLLCAATASSLQAQTSFGQPRQITDQWRFTLADNTTFSQTDFDDSRWQNVQVPHDWGVTQPMSPHNGSCQGYLPGGIGWYRLHFQPTLEDVAAGRKLYVYFEGVYNRSTVYVNGHELGYRPSGFASFLYDLTPYLQADADNVLAVRVDHSRQNDSRWYTGSGIYRPVWFINAPEHHLPLWGTSWRVVKQTAKQAQVEVRIDSSEGFEAPLVVDILDANEHVVATAKSRLDKSGAAVQLNISSPHAWTLDDPYLYKVRVKAMQGSAEIDHAEVPMGLRTLRFDPDHGFAINGVWTKVKGVCIHDDAGVLGTAVPSNVWRHRLTTLKNLGVNAIRMSHNPHAPALYALCDSLGLLVMDEASDEWEFPKRKWLKGWNQGTPGFEGTYDYFEEWIDRDVADMVRRDRCHPSIFLWSIGNEVDYPNDPYSHPVLDGGQGGFTQPMYGGYKPEQPNAERIGRIAQRLSAIVRSIDTSRPVTGALAGVVMSNETAYPEAVDVVGYNYTESRYQTDHQRYPRRVIYGSENRHDLPSWKAVTDNEHIFGQFLWTGIDYLGESGAWPARGSEAGLLDLAGFVKPLGHYRASLWATKPVCYIGTNPNFGGRRGRGSRVSPYAPALWNYNEGQEIRVMCYTNCPSARLLLNGQPIGGEPERDASTGILHWSVPYQPGTLLCEALDADGKVVSTSELQTTGRPYALRTRKLDPTTVIVEVVDEEGRVVPLADNEITCISRNARLLGLENGDIRDTRDRNLPRCRVRAGRLIAYFSASPQATFTSPLLKPATVE